MYLGAEASHFKQQPIAALEALRHPKSEILREMIFSSLPLTLLSQSLAPQELVRDLLHVAMLAIESVV